MKPQAYIAELIGTFSLTLGVSLSIIIGLPIPTPLVAALILGFFVYTIGPISGAHINPAVTIALATMKKISVKDSIIYIVFQIIGALLAMLLAQEITQDTTNLTALNNGWTGLAEAIGAFFLIFGISAVVHKKVHEAASGITIGWALLLGILMASSVSNGVLNPAVAIGIGSVSVMYMVGPIVGTIVGVWVYKMIADK